MSKLADTPGMGSDRGAVRPGLRKLNSGRHSIYFYHDGDMLRITRVLHARMDAGSASFD